MDIHDDEWWEIMGISWNVIMFACFGGLFESTGSSSISHLEKLHKLGMPQFQTDHGYVYMVDIHQLCWMVRHTTT
jgi:hypothetical protein